MNDSNRKSRKPYQIKSRGRVSKIYTDMGICGACCFRALPTGYLTCEVCRDKAFKRYHGLYKDKVNANNRMATKVDRAIVYHHYGNKCICCGESNQIFLQVDHINNDGYKRRKEEGTGAALYRWIIKNNFPDHLQLLCANCNFGKRMNNGVCPHQQRTYDPENVHL